MEAFKTNKKLKDENAALKTALEEAEGNAETLQGQLDTANASIVEKDETIATLTTEASNAKETNAALVTELEDTQEKLAEAKKETEEAEKSSTAKAIDIAASAGHTKKLVPESEDNSMSLKKLEENAQNATDPKEKYKAIKELQNARKQS